MDYTQFDESNWACEQKGPCFAKGISGGCVILEKNYPITKPCPFQKPFINKRKDGSGYIFSKERR